MKILIAMYDIGSIGGIVNHTDQLIAGLRETGHEVDLIKLSHSTKSTSEEDICERTDLTEYAFGDSEYYIHQKKGIICDRFGYLGNIPKWKKLANQYNMVLWTTPIPGLSKDLVGNVEWMKLYDLVAKQYAIIHDGNIQKMYPHIYKLRNKFEGLFCVHETALNTAYVMPVKRMLLLNPQDVAVVRDYSWADRKKGFLSLQTFKAWKRVDELMRAIPHLPKRGFNKYIAGGGIEWYYMTSENKRKEAYGDIWERAEDNNMKFLGYISEEKRDEVLRQVRVLIDPSYSKRYSESGAHFNRVIVDSMKMGVIPMAVTEMTHGIVFKEWENFIPLNRNSPEEYAESIKMACNLSASEAREILDNNYKLMKKFDRKRIAKQLVSFMDEDGEVGSPTEKFKTDCNRVYSKFCNTGD